MKRVLFLAIVLSSCEVPFDADIPRTQEVVVNAFAGAGNTLDVQLSTSNYILDPEEISPLSGAEVSLFDEEGLIEVLAENGTGNYEGTYLLNEGTNYRIEVESEGFRTVQAQDEIPQAVPIASSYVENRLSALNLGEFGYKTNMSFMDDPNEENFYAIEVIILKEGIGEALDGEIGYMITEDPDVGLSGTVDISIGDTSSIEKASIVLFFNDINFNGREHNLNFYLVPFNIRLDQDTSDEVHLVLKSISESYYNYLRTTNFQRENEESGNIAEPVQIESNVENGLGIFACYNYDILEAEVRDPE